MTEFNALRADIISAIDRGMVSALPKLFENMTRLADGGYKRVERKWEAQYETDPGTKHVSRFFRLAEKKITVAEPDRAANQYLIDRVLGKPRQSIEMTGAEGGPIQLDVEAAAAKIYGQGD